MPPKQGLLLPYQYRWFRDQSEVKIAEKSRRIGLSWTTACESVLLSARTHGTDTWYVGYSKDMAVEFINDCAFWARGLNVAFDHLGEILISDESRQILAFAIRFPSGHRITALSSRPAGLRGKQGYVVIDEAAYHDDLGGLLKAAMAMLMWGGRIAIISTHNGVDSEFNQLLLENRAGERDFSEHTITFDDALRDGFYARLAAVRGLDTGSTAEAAYRQKVVEFYGADADEELFCQPRALGRGDHFKKEWFNVLPSVPDNLVALVRGHDLAATERTKKNKDPDWTRSVLIGKYHDKRLCVCHGSGLRGGPGEVNEHLRKLAEADGHEVTQAFWQDPGQAGKAQAAELRKLLTGYPVAIKVASKDKLTYAGPLSSLARVGRVDIVAGAWNRSFLAELESFPPPVGKGHDDWVDGASRAEIELRTRGGGATQLDFGARDVILP